MICLSAPQLSEISAFPDLLNVVDNNCVLPNRTDAFTQACAQHNCVESFLHALPHSSFAKNPLTFLARLDRWNIVERMDCTQFSPDDWKKAIRRAGKSGHMEFIDNILTLCVDTDAFVRTTVVGASMNDQLDVVQRFLPSITDQDFVGHIAVTAAQHGSINCARYCLQHITPQQWLGALSSTVNTHRSEFKVANMLLDHTPLTLVPSNEWCIKFTKRMSYTAMDNAERVWRFILHHMPFEDVEKIVSHWSNDKKQKLRDIHQNVLLTYVVNNMGETTMDCAERATSKRKM